MQGVLRHIRQMALQASADSQSDAQLLEAFLARRDEEAIAALVRRHGPMVMGVCRRVLRHAQDAEDAFQATFLVLVRKASSLRSQPRLGSWLYGVAYRTAMKARAMSAKRRSRERQAGAAARCAAKADGAWDALLEHLDAELSRLPEKYRTPVVLCELQGTGRKEAAKLLGLPEGTLSWRLAHARKLLAARLARHRVSLPAGALLAACAGQASASVSPSLLAAVTRASVVAAAGQPLVTGMVSARVISLTEGVLKAMLLTKLKVVGTMLLAVSLTAATGLTFRATAGDEKPERDAPQVTRPVQNELEALRLEIEALRKAVQTTRDRVSELEAGMRQVQQGSRGGGDGKDLGKPKPRAAKPQPGESHDVRAQDKEALSKALAQAEEAKTRAILLDLVAEVEQALGQLRQRPRDQVKEGKQAILKGTFKIDPSKSLKAIDLEASESGKGDHKSTTAELMKRLEGAVKEIHERTSPEGSGAGTGSSGTRSGPGRAPSRPARPQPPATPAEPASPRAPAPPRPPAAPDGPASPSKH